MKKVFLAAFWMVLVSASAVAQEWYEISSKSDSIIAAFDKILKNVNYEKTELVSFGDNFYYDVETCDTFLLENTQYYKHLRTKKKDKYVMFVYYNGNISDQRNEEKTVYYFYDKKLLLTCNSYSIKTIDYDDMSYFFTFEEKRMVFGDDGKPWGYIVRDGEGTSKETDVSKIRFSKIDIDRIIYDKNMFETIGMRLMAGEIDFLYY